MSIRRVAALACALVGCSFDGSSPPGTIGDASGPRADATIGVVDADLSGDAAPACADLDGDGYSVALAESESCGAVLDCDDDDARAFPGQRTFFVEPRPSGSFDFDCDGDEEPINDVRGFACQVDWDGCLGTGWLEDPPACGAMGTFHECGYIGLACRELGSESAQMSCR